MKKRKVILGFLLIVLFTIFEIKGIDLSKITLDINSEKTNQNTTEPTIDEIEITEFKDSDLKVYYIDVGQADCVLIQNNNENMLIDAGNNEDGEKLVKYFKELGITSFKYVVGTHPHEDHIGGLDDVINSFDIDTILLPDAYTTTTTFMDVLDAIDNKNMTFTVPKENDKYQLGEANIDILYSGVDVEDLNDASIVIKLTYGSNKFLFSGDATTKVEKQILNKDLKVDVYKVAHHGSNTSNSAKFLEKLNPKYGIISCGKDNSYNHPHDEIVNRLEKRNIEIYRTDKLGTILVTSDGVNINISSFKTDTNG